MAVVYKTGTPIFEPVEVSESKITAVCADDDEDYFYIGDEEGNIYTLNNEGEVLASSQMPEETAGAVLLILNIPEVQYCFLAYSAKGFTQFNDVTSDIYIEGCNIDAADWSLDGDGTFHFTSEEGEIPAFQYNATTEARVVTTLAITEGGEYGNFNSVFSLVIADEEAFYSNIETVITSLSVRKGAGLGEQVRLLEFDFPVKQVISCRHHTGGEAEADDIYVLLCDGDLLKVIQSIRHLPSYEFRIQSSNSFLVQWHSAL